MRTFPISKEVWIEQEDFMEVPSKGYFRLFPGNKVRLRYGYVVECTGCDKDADGKDFKLALNPNAKEVIMAYLEPGMSAAQADERFQFERHGYFVADRVDHSAAKPVFNRAVTLKDSWGK